MAPASRSGCKAYGSLGALAQCTHHVELLLEVGPGSFRPRPRVRSRVVRLTRRARPLFPAGEWRRWAELIHAAFSQRRKQLPVALAGLLGRDREDWRGRLVALGQERP